MNYKRTQPGLDLHGSFLSLLLRWPGSVYFFNKKVHQYAVELPSNDINLMTFLISFRSLYKLCYKEILFFIISFEICSVVYRFVLEDYQKRLLFRFYSQNCVLTILLSSFLFIQCVRKLGSILQFIFEFCNFLF